jgi:hypothetical protein
LPPRYAGDSELGETLLACLPPEPADRLPSATELATRLAQIAERLEGAPSGRQLGRRLLEKIDDKKAPAGPRRRPRQTARTVLDRIGETLALRQERRAFIWLSLAAAAALAIAAFLLAGRG